MEILLGFAWAAAEDLHGGRNISQRKASIPLPARGWPPTDLPRPRRRQIPSSRSSSRRICSSPTRPRQMRSSPTTRPVCGGRQGSYLIQQSMMLAATMASTMWRSYSWTPRPNPLTPDLWPMTTPFTMALRAKRRLQTRSMATSSSSAQEVIEVYLEVPLVKNMAK